MTNAEGSAKRQSAAIRLGSDLSVTSTIALLLLGFLVLQIVVMIVLAVSMFIMPRAKESVKSTDRYATPQKVLKCLPFGQSFGEDCPTIIGIRKPTEVPKYVSENGAVEYYELNALQLDYPGKINCTGAIKEKYQLNPAEIKEDAFHITPEGQLLNREKYVISSVKQFCIDYCGPNIIAAVCPKTDVVSNKSELYVSVLVVLLVVSLAFLICTFLVYALVGKSKTLHGKYLMSEVATLTMGYVGLLLIRYTRDGNKDSNSVYCAFLAFFTQFSFLACVYWLNVLSFDIWWTFSGRKQIGKASKREESKMFKTYSVYAWGCSLLILIFTCLTEYFPLGTPSGLLSPRFSTSGCWFDNNYKNTATLYFYGPLTTLLICNFLMFIHITVIMVVQFRNRDSLTVSSDSNRNAQKNTGRYVMYLKLFMVMGIGWLGEMISWYLYTKDETEQNIIVEYMCKCFELFQAVRGVLIFIIFVCKSDVLISLNRKLCPQYVFIGPNKSIVSFNTKSTTLK